MGKLQDMRDAQREDIQKTDIMEVKREIYWILIWSILTKLIP